MAQKIQLIIGSTREGRIGGQVADWVKQLAANIQGLELTVVDLKDINLPFFTAPLPPLYAPDQTEHGKAWAAQVADADGYIFLTPEYNHSIPASLKNALDYLASEWQGKPAAIVSYGYGGGAFADRHLRDVLAHLKMQAVESPVNLVLRQDMLENGKLKNIQQDFSQYKEALLKTLNALVG